jgi:hypothetical protein
MSTTTYTGVRITDMPDLGPVTDSSSVVGEHAGSGRFGAIALRDYVSANLVTQAEIDALHLPFNVRAYGAAGNGVTDDTAACQAAITAAGAGGTVFFPTGTYLLSATLNALTGQQLLGEGPNNSILTRTADYGDTIRFAQAWGVAVKGLWFRHSTLYGLTDTSLPNRVTSNSAHLRLQNAQGVTVEDCWMWRMPYQIAIDDGSLVKVHRCNIQGCWDPNYAAAQEGIAGIQVGGVAYTQIIAVEHCYMAGSGNGPRNVTFTSVDTGAHTFSITQSCGNQFGIQIIQCEDFILANTYMGSNSSGNVMSDPKAGSVNLDWRFIGNFFDGAGITGAMIQFYTQADNTYPTAVTIAGNVFNGEMQTQNAISAQNIAGGNNPTLTNFAITGNSFMATVGSAIMLNHARGGTITGNSITSYNARQVTAGADLAFCAAVYFGAHASHIVATGNLAGGSVNAADTPSYCYRDFYLTGAPGSNVAVNNIIVGGGGGGNLNGLVRENVVIVSAAGNYTMIGNEDVIVVNKTVAAVTQIFLPTGFVPAGYTVTIKDGKGDANVNGTQMVGTVDGVSNPLYTTAWFCHRLLWNGGAWNVIGN